MDLLQNQSPVRKKNKSWKFYTVLVFIAVSLFLSVHFRSLRKIDSPREAQANTPQKTSAFSPSASSAPVEVVKFHVVSGRVQKNQTFYDLMTGQGVTPQEVARLTASARKVYDLRKLLPGRSYELSLDAAGSLQKMSYVVDPENTFVVRRTPQGFAADMEQRPFEIHLKRVEGEIESSLFEAIHAIGEGPELAVMLSEIYAWDIDFNFDIRKGDRFTILFEEKWQEGRFYGYGRILAAEFVNHGERLRAVYYEGRKGKKGYYTPEGKSLQKQFLRSPLKFSRISSKFTYKRFHPILKAYRPHLGVDYVAPRGTPIHSAGDGKVIFAARKGGNGNFVKIRHNGTYMSGYLHLSRFARGIRKGKYVKQGQVIGYVGATGLATGPHLCYRFYKHGKFVNPLTVKFPSASPVPKKEIQAFRGNRDHFLALLLKRPPAYRVDRQDYLIAKWSLWCTGRPFFCTQMLASALHKDRQRVCEEDHKFPPHLKSTFETELQHDHRVWTFDPCFSGRAMGFYPFHSKSRNTGQSQAIQYIFHSHGGCTEWRLWRVPSLFDARRA